jgi:Phage portal protein, lambda family
LEHVANRGQRLSPQDRNRFKTISLTENYTDYSAVNGYEEAFDGARRGYYQPISLYQDRRYGANWPFWRTWLEHARIRAGARLMCTASTLASGALRGLTNYVIGEGYTDKAEWKPAAGKPDKLLLGAVNDAITDFNQENEWNLRQREIFANSRRDGDVAWRFFPDLDEGMLHIRQVLPEQIMEPAGMDPGTQSFGVLTGPEDLERAVAYWICYDGDAGRPDDPDGVPAEEVCFIKVNVDRGVKRGLSDFSFDTYDGINSAQHLQENMTEGAAIQASIALIRQHEASIQSEIAGFVEGGANGGNPSPYVRPAAQRYYPGRVEDIDKGFTYIEPPGASNAAGHAQVFSTSLRSVAVRWNAPEWLISGDASNNNYASSITAESPFVKSCKAEQSLYKPQFNRTIR